MAKVVYLATIKSVMAEIEWRKETLKILGLILTVGDVENNCCEYLKIRNEVDFLTEELIELLA